MLKYIILIWVEYYVINLFLWQFSDLHQIIRILLYCLIFLLSILGNILVITVLIRNKRMRTVTNTFLLSLAVSDLMLCLFCMPFTLIPNLLKDFIFGSAVCKTATYFMGKSRMFILILKTDEWDRWEDIWRSIKVWLFPSIIEVTNTVWVLQRNNFVVQIFMVLVSLVWSSKTQRHTHT